MSQLQELEADPSEVFMIARTGTSTRMVSDRTPTAEEIEQMKVHGQWSREQLAEGVPLPTESEWLVRWDGAKILKDHGSL
jgi:hypothetical protein